MKQNPITHSILLIISILIISLFLWTASAVGDINIDKSNNSIGKLDISVNNSVVNEDIDDNTTANNNTTDGVNDEINVANNSENDASNSGDDIVILEEDAANPEEDIVNPADDAVNPEETVNSEETVNPEETVDPENNTVNPEEDIVNPADDAVNPEETVNPGNDTANPEEIVNPGNDTVNPEETVNPADDAVNPEEIVSPEETVNPEEAVSPEETIDPEETVNPVESANPEGETVNPGEDSDNSGDTKSPELTVDEPSTNFVCTRTVLFNFSAIDKLDDNLTYTLYINDTERSKGSITEGEWKQVEINLDDGYYIWALKIEDSLGNVYLSEPAELNVDTKAPTVSLISPDDCLVNTGGPLNFSFTADNDLDDLYKDQDLTYEVDVDGETIEGTGSGTMRPGECIQTQDITDLSDGAHDWSVYIEDEAGNNVTSDTRTFYVDKKGLRVSLVSPDNEHVSSVKPTFKFRVSGGTGLPFDYILLVDGKEVKKSTYDGSENRTLEVGEESANDYSIEAAVPDGADKTWTVNIKDIAGNIYELEPYRFSLDTTDPGRVKNLSVGDALGETQWSYTHDSPGLYVSWDANIGEDLASTPYDVFVSDSEPHSIEDMEKVKSTSDTSLRIEKYGGKPLVYGKDYWVAVIARDKSGNYNKCFVAICGPGQTYEDMNITLDPGWNMKSVPKRLLESNSSPESVFGKGSTILYWNGKSWEAPKTIEPCKGYWIYSPVAFENNVKFKQMSSDNESVDLIGSLDLAPGWQMIGSTSMQPVAWSTTMASLENSNTSYKFSNLITYSRNEGWSGVIPELGLTDVTNGSESVISNRGLANDSDPRPVGMLQNEGMMVPGQGYWVYITKEGTYDPSESDGTAVDVPIDVSMTDNGTIDEGNTDNVTVDGGTAEDVGFDEESTDNGTADDVSIDNGTADNISADDNNTDNGTANIETVDDVGVGEESADGATTEGGTAEDVGFNAGDNADGTTDNGITSAGNADDIPIKD